MPFIPTPNCVQAELVFNYQGEVVQNVLHYVKESPWETGGMEELAEELKEAWATHIRTLIPASVVLNEVRITDLSSVNAPVVNYTTGLPLAGAGGTPSLPNNVTIVMTKRTILRGRSFRGRLYHVGLSEADVTGNTVSSTVVNNLRNAYSNFIGISLPILGTEALLVVLSLYSNGQPRAQGVATLVDRFTSEGILDSQRRRLPGRGQ